MTHHIMPATSTYTKVEKITDADAVKKAYVPTHPGKFAVDYAEGDYNSKLVASQSYKKGETICQIEGSSPGPKRYTSVQVGKDAHIELNSDRKSCYILHSFRLLFPRLDP